MTTKVAQKPTRSPLIGYVVGRYWAAKKDSDGRNVADMVTIADHVRLVIRESAELRRRCCPLFTPHLNTNHFEFKVDGIGEEIYQLFDRIILRTMCDYIFACSNWQASRGGVEEVRLANSLGIPVFTSIKDISCWLREQPFSHVLLSEETTYTKEDLSLATCLIEGPFISDQPHVLSHDIVADREQTAEDAARQLWSARIACITGPMNSSYVRTGHRISEKTYDIFMSAALARGAVKSVLLLPGWQSDMEIRKRVNLAAARGVPCFIDTKDVIAFFSSRTPHVQYSTIALTAPRT